MFDKYTEAARKVVFFARYEASQSGSPTIEVEHLLLGVLREDRRLLLRVLGSAAKLKALRERMLQEFPVREKTSTSVDLPLSKGSRRALAYAAEEAQALKQSNVEVDHLLVGISREEPSTAARVLAENGATTKRLRQEIARQPIKEESYEGEEPVRELVAAAERGELGPLVGRERELDRIIQILSRRTKCNPVLIGGAGVGKSAIVGGLACRIAAGNVPVTLAECWLIAVDASSLTAEGQLARELEPVFNTPNAILFVRGLFNLAAAGSAWAVVEAMHALEPHLASGKIQCIATGSSAGLRETIEKAGMLARHFEIVNVGPVSEEDAVRIVDGLKTQFEKFHEVTFAEGAIETAVAASGRFLPDRNLPDRAIDLIDEAAAAVRLRREAVPPEVTEVRRAIRGLERAAERAIASHEFDAAKQIDAEERGEREKLERLREQHHLDGTVGRAVTAEDIVAAVATRVGVPVDAVERVLAEKEPGELERIAGLLVAQVPAEDREWAPFLAAYLARCSPAEVAALAQAIGEARPAS